MARKVVLADASELRSEATGARELPGAAAIAAAIKQRWICVLRQKWSEPALPLLDTGEASILRAAIAPGPGTLVLLDDLHARHSGSESR